MNLVKQILVTLVFLLAVAAAWIKFDPAPGQYLLAENSPLPPSLRGVVSSLSPADDEPRVGATEQRSRGESVPLVTVDVAAADVTRDRLQAIGTGEAERSVAVYPEASGIVTGINFEPGDTVAAGDVLATLQDNAERLAVDRARIALEAARSQAERFEALSSSVSAVQLDEARRAVENAGLDLRAAEIALERRSILAPIDGRVGLTPIEIGALVGNQTLIATIDDRRNLRVVFNAPEGFVSSIRVGHPVSATPTTRSGRVYQGEVTALDSRIDEASRTLRVEATVDNSSDDLRPGMSFTVELGFEGEAYLSVLPLSIQWERAGPYVWVIAEETVSKAPVAIVERNVERVLVSSEVLEAGDQVIAEGSQQVREGISVRVANPAAMTQPIDPEQTDPSMSSDGVPSAEAETPGSPGAQAEAGSAEAAAQPEGTPAVRVARTAGEAPAGANQ